MAARLARSACFRSASVTSLVSDYCRVSACIWVGLEGLEPSTKGL